MSRWLWAIVGMAMVGGCASPRPVAENPRSASASPAPARPEPAATTPSRPVPSLEQAQRSQAERAAAALSKRVGVELEPVSGPAPSWWAATASQPGSGRGQGGTLESAYQQAVRQARAGGSTAPVKRAAYARLSSGEYLVWVSAGEAAARVDTPAAAPVVQTPPPPPPPSPEPTRPESVPTVEGAPAWFSTAAREVDGRVQVGAYADAPTVREAPRMATEAARAALAEVMGREVTDLRLESTYVRKVGEHYRAYVLVSAPGRLRK